MAPRHRSSPAAYTVVYDGECQVCSRLASVLRRRSRGQVFDVIPFQEAGVAARFPSITPHDFRTSLQLIGNDGQTWQGAAAVEQILRSMPRGRWISWLFRMPFVRFFADRLYRWFARNRYRFGCREHCAR